jgi:hypothetical protein
MAVVATHLLSADTGTDGTSFTTPSTSVTAGRLVVVAVMIARATGSAADTTINLSGLGTTWTQVATRAFGGSNRFRVTVFSGVPPADATGSLTASVTNVHEWFGVLVTSFAGVDTSAGTNGVVQSATAADSGSAVTGLTVTLGTFSSAQNATYGVFGVGGLSTISPGTGFSMLGQTANVERNVGAEFKASPDTDVDATWSGSQRAGAIALEIAASASQTKTKTVDGAIGPSGTVDRQKITDPVIHVGASSAWSSTRYVDLPTPANVVSGDLLLAFLNCLGGSSATITPPAGWTLLARENYDGSDTTMATAVYRRIAGASEPATHRFDVSVANRAPTMVCVALRNQDPTTPLDAGPTVLSDGTFNSAAVAPSVLTVTTGTRLVCAWATKSPVTITPPSDMTLSAAVTSAQGSNDRSLAVATLQRFGVGDTGQKIAQLSASTNRKHGWSLAVRPASPPAMQTKILDGATTPAGTVDARKVQVVKLAGATGPTGTPGRQPRQRVGGTVGFAGFELEVVREPPLASPPTCAGAVSPTGDASAVRLSSTAVVNLAGAIGTAKRFLVDGQSPPGGGGPSPPIDTLHDLEPPFDAVLLVPTTTDAVWLAPGTLDVGGT